MEFISVSQCNKCLEFKPVQPWPRSLPAIAIDGVLLTDFSAEGDRVVINLTSANLTDRKLSANHFAQVFLDCYSDLTLSELARFYVAANASGLDFVVSSFSTIVESMSLRDSESLREALLALTQTPLSFQNWASKRALAARELAVLKSVPALKTVAPILTEIAKLEMTRSQGAIALELALELFLMGFSVEKLLNNNAEPTKDPQTWLTNLERLRRPQSMARETSAQELVKSLPWPAYAQARWQRQGDRGGIEVKVHFSSSEDMKRKLAGLASVQAVIETNPRVWKQNAPN